MKKYFLNSAFIIILTITLTGCYTVIWDPSQNSFPARDNASGQDGYYSLPFYGGYSIFYDQPWWYDVTYGPGLNQRSPDQNGSAIRNMGSGRGETTRNGWNLYTNPPSRNITQTGNVSKSSTNSNNTTTRSETGRSSDSSTNSRNSNGSRNSGSGRGR